MAKSKKCTICGLDKLIDEYHLRKDKDKPERRRTECKLCVAERSRRYQRENSEKRKAWAKEYNKRTADSIREKNKIYREKNKEELKQKMNVWREENKEKIALQRANFYRENKERLSAYKKTNYIKNRAYYRAKQEKYDAKNKEKLMVARRKWERNRLSTDIQYKLAKLFRGRIRVAFKIFDPVKCRKAHKTEDLIGCPVPYAIKHLERQFREGMSWENHGEGDGKWHIDHKTPVSWFDLSDMEEVRLAFHYTNLQPLWGRDNIIKNNRYADV